MNKRLRIILALLALTCAIGFAIFVTPAHAQTQNQILPTWARGGGVVVSTSSSPTATLGSQAISYFLDRANHTGTQLASTISDFVEAAQDAVGTILTDSDRIDFTYTDGGPTITADIVNNSIGDTQLAFNTGQNLTSASSPTFAGLTVTGEDGCAEFTAGVLGSTGSACGSGGGGVAWGAITGTLSAQTDLQNALNAKFSLADWYATTTSALTEGSNLYFTNVRADARAVSVLAGTTTLPNITTLANLDTVKTTLTGLLKATSGVLSAAVAGTDYEVPLTFGDGLTRTGDDVDVDVVQNITRLSNLTSNGFVKTGSGNGTLSIDTNTYLTGNQTITLSGDVSGSGTTAITTTIGNGVVTNAMLANSTISGVALGSNLSSLTATDATLTFSGAYNGGTARTVGINLGNANTWSAKQTFSSAAVSGITNSFLATDGSGNIVATSTPGGSNFFTNSGASTYLSTGTNLGVGTSSPSAKLSLETGDYTTNIMTSFAQSLTATTTKVEVFTSSGTWTKPAGLVSAVVQAIGAGGGGGNGAAGNISSGGGSTAFQDADQLCVGTGGGSGVYKGQSGNNFGSNTAGGSQHTGPSGTNGGGSGGGSGSMATCTYTNADLTTTTTITIGMQGSVAGAGGTGYFAGGSASGGGATGAGSGATGGTGGSPYGTITNGNNGGYWSSGVMGLAGGASVLGGAGGNGGTTNATSPATPVWPTTLTFGAGGGGGASTGSGQPGAQGVVIITSTIAPVAATTSPFTIKPMTDSAGTIQHRMGVGTSSPVAMISAESVSSSTPLSALGGWAYQISTTGSLLTKYLFELLDGVGHLYTGGPTPYASTCGTITGNDRTGRTTAGGTSCLFTFANAWDSAPVCTVAPGTASTYAVTTTVTGATFTFGTSQGSGFSYICQGIK